MTEECFNVFFMHTTTETPRHRVVTVERGTDAEGRPGYAARCDTEGCGAITFGGFRSRTEARRALAEEHGRRA